MVNSKKILKDKLITDGMIMMTEETSSFLHGSQCAIMFARGSKAELRTLIKHKKKSCHG